MSELASRMKDAMKANRHGQGWVAEEFGVTQGAVSKWLSGSNVPGTELHQQLAEYLGVDDDEFRRLVEADQEERRDPLARVEAEVAGLRADVAGLRADVGEAQRLHSAVKKLEGSVETLTEILGAAAAPTRPGRPARRPSK